MNKEILKLLVSLDNIKTAVIEKYCKKYNIPILTNKKCMIAGLHKMRLYTIDKEITDEMKDKSSKWLKENNFSEYIF